MAKYGVAVLAVAVMAGSSGFAAAAEAEQAVQKFHEDWAAAWKSGDAERMAAFYDIRTSAHFDLERNPHRGRDAIRQHLATMLSQPQANAISNLTLSVTRSDPKSAWVKGTFELTGGTGTSTVHFEHGIDVSDEEWHIFMSIWMTPEAWAKREKKLGETEKKNAAAPKPEGPLREELLDLLKSGRKIKAIMRYREETGVGVAAAKGVIDELEAGLPE